MQDRYAGDIGDFGKFGLLRAFRRNGLEIGVNWYKTEPLDEERREDGSFRQRDGRHLIPNQYAVCDWTLAEALSKIARSETRSVAKLEKAGLIPGAVYYPEIVTVKGRGAWHQGALEALQGADLVFLDPDNGLLVKSVGRGAVRSVKYVFYEEAADYVRRGQSVAVYNHRGRKRPGKYFEEIRDSFAASEAFRGKTIFTITFPRFSIRDYFIICANADHSSRVLRALDQLLYSSWGEKGVCQISDDSRGLFYN